MSLAWFLSREACRRLSVRADLARGALGRGRPAARWAAGATLAAPTLRDAEKGVQKNVADPVMTGTRAVELRRILAAEGRLDERRPEGGACRR